MIFHVLSRRKPTSLIKLRQVASGFVTISVENASHFLQLLSQISDYSIGSFGELFGRLLILRRAGFQLDESVDGAGGAVDALLHADEPVEKALRRRRIAVLPHRLPLAQKLLDESSQLLRHLVDFLRLFRALIELKGRLSPSIIHFQHPKTQFVHDTLD